MKYATIDTTGAVTGFYDDSLHENLPAGAVPLTDADYADWVKNQTQRRWIDNALTTIVPGSSLEEAQSWQSLQLRRDCTQTILGGFPSSALGYACTYPASATDQRNLADTVSAANAVTSSDWNAPLWCAGSAGDWAFRSHSAAQVRQVNTEWLAFRTAQQQKLTVLMARLASATDTGTALAVTWSS